MHHCGVALAARLVMSSHAAVTCHVSRVTVPGHDVELPAVSPLLSCRAGGAGPGHAGTALSPLPCPQGPPPTTHHPTLGPSTARGRVTWGFKWQALVHRECSSIKHSIQNNTNYHNTCYLLRVGRDQSRENLISIVFKNNYLTVVSIIS